MPAPVMPGGFPAAFAPGFRPPEPIDTFAPVRLEVRVSPARPRRGQQAVLEVQVIPESLTTDAELELVVEAGVLGSPPPTLRIAVGAGGRQVLPGLRFVPRVLGSDSFRLAALLRTAADGKPLGRWTATHVVEVEDAAAAQPAGDDVFALAQRMLAAVPGGSDSVWQSLDLQPDPAYRRWLRATAPADGEPVPALPVPAFPGPAAFRLCLGPRAVAMVVGRSAVLGRGGDPSVPWWVKPVPYNRDDHVRISRQHVTLGLRDGRAWLTDTSNGGTFVTQPGLRPRSPAVKGRPELLAAGDEVQIPGVAPFRVGLEAEGDRVYAVWLHRTDTLATTLSYLLTDGTAAVPLRAVLASPPVAYVAWAAGPEMLLLTSAGSWTKPAPRATAPLPDGQTFRWDPLTTPPEQDWFASR
jgi:hypothetical protein